MKQCGYKEGCFVPGYEEWGNSGSLMCKKLIEKELNRQPYSFCTQTNKLVHLYHQPREKK